MHADTPWVLRDPARLADVAEGWASLVPSSAPPTQHPDWTEAGAATVHADRGLRVVGVGDPARPRALAPLCRTPTSLGPVRQVGASLLGEPADLLYADIAAAEELVDALLDLRSAVTLRRLPADSEVLKAALATGSRRALVLVRPGDGAPFIDLDESWTEPERRLSSSRRGALRRSRRRIQEHGEMTVDVRRPTPEEVPALLDEAFRVEASSWKGESATALAHDAERGAFYRRYFAASAGRGTFVAAFLRVDGRPVAMQLGVETGTHLWVLKIGYDEEFARCSPGNVLTAELIGDAARRGLERYEFLGSPSPWIDAWTLSRHSLVTVSLAPMRPVGVAVSMSEAARRAAVRWAHRRPARGVRMRLGGTAS